MISVHLNKVVKVCFLLTTAILLIGCSEDAARYVNVQEEIVQGSSVQDSPAQESISESNESGAESERDEPVITYARQMLGEPSVSIKPFNQTVSIEHMDHSQVMRETLIPAYFEKLVVKGDSVGARKINAYFEEQYENWLNSRGDRLSHYYDGSMTDFFTDTNYGGMPKYFTVDTEVTFISETLISVRQCERWSKRSRSVNFFGSTFDLNTGEPVPFTYFVDIGADEFRGGLKSFLDKYGIYPVGAVRKFFDGFSKAEFTYMLDEHGYDLSYDYYYDGASIFLMIDNIAKPRYIAKWNGKSGELFDAELYVGKETDEGFEISEVHFR
jgi:hypothetical protein